LYQFLGLLLALTKINAALGRKEFQSQNFGMKGEIWNISLIFYCPVP
jgi:hypothetical protein